MKSKDKFRILPDYVLSDEFWDIISKETTHLPVDIYIDNASITEDGNYGIWYGISKKEILNVYKFSFVDINGNFYCDKERTFLSDLDLLEIQKFVMFYREEIISLSYQDLDKNEFINEIVNNLIGSISFTPYQYFTENKTQSRLREFANLKKEDTGLPCNIWVDESHNNLKHAKRIKYQTDTSNKINLNNFNSVPIDIKKEDIYNIPDKYLKGSLDAKKIREVFNFIINNKPLLTTLCDPNNTGIRIEFFKAHCIKGGELKEKESRELEKLVLEEVRKFRQNKGLYLDYDIYENARSKRSIINNIKKKNIERKKNSGKKRK